MNLFNQISGNKPGYNSFDLSHEKKMSFNMGELIPCLVQEIVPGDKFKVNTEIMLRLAPMLAPIMHRVNVFTHYFFVPNRLTWSNWEDFITGGRQGDLVPELPVMRISDTRKAGFYKGKLPDYMNIPIQDGTQVFVTTDVSALPFRAYQIIYDQYYRDQNVSDPLDIEIDADGLMDAADQTVLVELRKRAWEKDYFTSCLPWAQRGGDVNLPIDSEFSPQYTDPTIATLFPGVPADGDIKTQVAVVQSSTGQPIVIENLEDPQVIDSTSITINDLRLSVRLQEWLEKNARGGARYIEQIMSHFGVKSSDARLQRAEYLGGGKSPVVISEVLQTAEGVEPTGTMTGHGLSVGNSNSFTKKFEEHGHIIGIVSVLPRTSYQQGIERMYTKFDKLDYYWPEFAHLGEQKVFQKELFYKGNNGELPETGFGYQSRYAEYKYRQSSVHGDFRDDFDFWHMGRIFDTPPVLNNDFVKSDPTHRIFAVETESVDKIWAQLYNNVKAVRPMPKFGTPLL